MKRYQNQVSGIEAYDSGDGWVRVYFKDGTTYEYCSPPVASHHMSAMRQKAEIGDELNTYINTHREEIHAHGIKIE